MSSSNNNDDTATASWPDLPPDLVCQILGRFEITDFIRFAAVCNPWNEVSKINSKNCRPKPSALPWLMLSSPESPGHRYFYSLTEQRMFKMHLPQISGRQIIGSSDGFLISIDDESQLYITNPLTGTHTILPSAVTLPGFHGTVRDPSTGRITDYLYWDVCPKGVRQSIPCSAMDMRDFYFPKAIVGASTVFIIFGERNLIAVARPGETSWRTLNYSQTQLYDLIFHKGPLHAVDFSGRVVVFDDIDHSLDASFVSPRGPVGSMCGNNKRYLVESPDGEGLFLIYREMHDDDNVCSGQANRTAEFQVFKIESESNNYTWTPVTDVGGISFFLGYNLSLVLSVEHFPQLRRNCVYFTDDLKALCLQERSMASDTGVYDLGDGSIYPLVPGNIDHERLCWPRALWFTPVPP